MKNSPSVPSRGRYRDSVCMKRESRSSYQQLPAFVSCLPTRLFLPATVLGVTTRSTLSSPPMDFRSPEAASVRVPATFSILRHVYFSPYFSSFLTATHLFSRLFFLFRATSFERVYSTLPNGCTVRNFAETRQPNTRCTRV